MVQPDVSFVIAAYNAQETLAKAIDSALAQQNVSVEVVVVDDRSTDKTPNIAEAYDPDHVRLFSSETNAGPAAARNLGFAEASGRWIAVLDADDTVYRNRMATLLSRAATREADIVVDNMCIFHEKTKKSRVLFSHADMEAMESLSLARFIAGNNLFEADINLGYFKPVFKRTFLEKNSLRYDESLRIGEDYLLMAYALAKGAKCVVEPTVGYSYTVREGSISRVLRAEHVAAMRRADRHFEKSVRLDDEERKVFLKRQQNLGRAAAFLEIVNHLKTRSLFKAFKVAVSDPPAVRHLGMPIAERLRRVTSQFATGS